jgi:nitrite reductase/ring-hydroxylating ferredoxin subunit
MADNGVRLRGGRVPRAVDGDVPFRLEHEDLIPAARYYDGEFFEAEKEKLWTRVWQPACRLDEIPDAGDYTEYRILDRSYLIVRESPESVRAFENACRHRATALGLGTGTFHAGSIVCPFHGWRWNLDGTNAYVYGRDFFRPECLTAEEIDLKSVPVGIRYGFVWINPDREASFADWFDAIGVALDPLRLDLMRVNWWYRIELRANWKVAQEAFFEAWHVMQTHPEMAMLARDDDMNPGPTAGYGTSDQGHGWLSRATAAMYDDVDRSYTIRGRAPAEYTYNLLRVMWEGGRFGITERQLEIADDVAARGVSWDQFFEVYYRELFEDAARNSVPLPAIVPEMTEHCTVFPNFTIAGIFMGNAFAYRSRPTGPETCEYDFWAMSIPPEGTPVTRPVEGEGPDWDDLWFVHQDVSNIERQQVGLHADGLTELRASPYLDKMIINWHQALDRVLAR